MPTLDLCLNVVTDVMEGALLNSSCCIWFNITLAYFLRSIVHSPFEESPGTLI